MKFFVILATLIALAVGQGMDPRCPRGPNDNRPDIFGHPHDCSRFIRCFNGMAIELPCPSGRAWSDATQTCEPEHLSDCTSTQQFPNGRPRSPTNDVHQCPAFDVPGEFIYFPHRTDCRQFFQCSAGRAVQLECPPGFLWNTQRTFCDQQQNVHCVTPRL